MSKYANENLIPFLKDKITSDLNKELEKIKSEYEKKLTELNEELATKSAKLQELEDFKNNLVLVDPADYKKQTFSTTSFTKSTDSTYTIYKTNITVNTTKELKINETIFPIIQTEQVAEKNNGDSPIQTYFEYAYANKILTITAKMRTPTFGNKNVHLQSLSGYFFYIE